MADIARAIFGKENYTNREKCKKILEENNIDCKQWLKSKERHNYCLQCGREILGVDRFRKKFCNSSCAAKYTKNRKKPQKHCLLCGNPISHRQKFCSNKCQNDYIYKIYIENWLSGTENGLKGKCDISAHIRRYLLEYNNYTCQTPGCGCNWKNPYTGKSILQIHHIDGDCTNNKFENLQLLCPNCHTMTENYGNRNKNSTRIDRRTKYYRESQNK